MVTYERYATAYYDECVYDDSRYDTYLYSSSVIIKRSAFSLFSNSFILKIQTKTIDSDSVISDICIPRLISPPSGSTTSTDVTLIWTIPCNRWGAGSHCLVQIAKDSLFTDMVMEISTMVPDCNVEYFDSVWMPYPVSTGAGPELWGKIARVRITTLPGGIKYWRARGEIRSRVPI